MPQPTQMEVATRAAVQKLRAQGKKVEWIGFQKYSVDDQRVTLTELLKLAAYGKTD